jgi:exonuclease SbcD
VESFAGFDYVALGHLHRPQALGAGQRVRYAGSLLKYSFSEVDHLKSVALVELGSPGELTVTPVALQPRRDVRIVSGTLAELLSQPDATLDRSDYLCALLTDHTPPLEPMARLREVYPNMMELRFAASTMGAGAGRTPGDHRTRKPDDLFRAFYRDMLDVDIDDAAIEVFNAAANSLIGNDTGRSS